MDTPRQRAEALLKIHKGACFVPSSNDLVAPFCEMEREGLVTVKYSSIGSAISGITVRRKGYRVKPLETDYIEQPVH